MKKIRYIKIPVEDKREFFQAYLEITKALINLTANERLVLGEIMYWNDHYRYIKNEEERKNIVLSYENRMNIADYVGVSKSSLENILSHLRKKNVLDGNILNKAYDIKFQDNQNLLFIFEVNDRD